MRRSRPRLARFEIRPLAGKGIALAAGLVAIAVLVAGCGGDSGEDGPSEATLRKRLKAAAAKTAAAESLEASSVFEYDGSDHSDDLEPAGCVEVGVDRDVPGSLDIRVHDLDCGGPPDAEVLTVGRRAWVTGGDGRWVAMTMAPSMFGELSDEERNFDLLFAAATDLEESGDGTYEFEAPASAFVDPSGDRVDPEELTFEAKVDSFGYLSDLGVTASQDHIGVVVTSSYVNFNGPLEIAPPAPDEVVARHSEIHDKQELEEILETSF